MDIILQFLDAIIYRGRSFLPRVQHKRTHVLRSANVIHLWLKSPVEFLQCVCKVITWQTAVGHASHQRDYLLSDLTRCEESLFRSLCPKIVIAKL